MGMSLGRVNYVVNELLKNGYIKARRFKNSRQKIAYMYILTPKGMSQKIIQTCSFLQKKMDEYDRLKREIELLRQENEEDSGKKAKPEVVVR
jgi:EPS-associated MarR family transcriptional regulator